ncbi:hypothetical protein [Dinghuibacter silviterrae]|uniref:Uncharacterized protein n=1 Tax=Dinghuibacter silviterrae TaxID=1539049 RepID=A0A4R8DF24_9BACT|nr:hypothetical protein [Dinghuibacter silviterrae]TDW96171.1 hypothetical protein EDB95_3994 [Dinghuibacter silviterrae]
MQKVLAYVGIFLGLGLLVLSTSRPAMQWLSDKRYAMNGFWGVHHAPAGGDLVTMAYLDNQPRFCEPFGYTFTKPPDTGAKNVDLYVYGDSYVMYVPDSAFGPIRRYHFGRRDYTDLDDTLDRHQRNILIIENSERFMRLVYRNLAIFDHVRAAYAGIDVRLFNPVINQNLEFNLFSYTGLAPLRTFKADLTYTLFHRASGDVTLSDNGRYLFLTRTVLAQDDLSSYAPVPTPELTLLEANMDSTYRHYKRAGFDEVYFSIIPNPVTILQPRDYNGLIPALHQYAAAHGIPVIDVYTPFTKAKDPARLYRIGDTHWNNKGLQVWLATVNHLLETQAAYPSK